MKTNPSTSGRRLAPKLYRFDARLSQRQKTILKKAAELEGRTVTDFVLRSAEAAAERTIQERSMLTLAAKESEKFVKAILEPAAPNRALRSAMRDYRKTFAG